MNLNEAMHAMIDGKKVRQSSWSNATYCYYNEKSRAFYFEGAYFNKRAEGRFNNKDNWEIVPQKVLKKFEYYINIYSGGVITYLSREKADRHASGDRLGEAEHIVIERWVSE